jgi:hypothetical protein
MRKSVSVYEMKDFKVLDLFQPNDMWSYMDLPRLRGYCYIGEFNRCSFRILSISNNPSN